MALSVGEKLVIIPNIIRLVVVVRSGNKENTTAGEAVHGVPETRAQRDANVVTNHMNLLLFVPVVEAKHKAATDAEDNLREFAVSMFPTDADAVLEIVDEVDALDSEGDRAHGVDHAERAVVAVMDLVEWDIAALADTDGR